MNYSLSSNLGKSLNDKGCKIPLSAHRGFKPAFTLIELLVVITIIGILLTVGAMGLKNLSKASGVTAGLPIAEGVFSEARSLAQGNGNRSRVLINADSDDNERYLRFMLLVTESESGEWIAASRGIYLPEGVFFSREYSHLDHENSSGEFNGGSAVEAHNIFSSEDASINQNLSGDYFFYEFNSQGNAANPGASFVCGTGNKPPGAESPRVGSGGGVSNFGGFIVWRKGTTSLFRHTDQINLPDGIESGDEF